VRRSYARDPHWLEARYASPCACGNTAHQIKRGDRVFYYPIGRRAYTGACAESASNDFLSAAGDEGGVPYGS
jgi:hypothetical protein